MANLLRARLFRRARLKLLNVRLCPNDFRTVPTVELLNTLAGVAGDLAERINRVREHAGQHLHPIVSSARSVGPLITPAADDRAYLFRPFELRNPKLTKVVHDAVQPWRPVLARRLRELLVVRTGPVEHDERLEPAGLWRAAALDRFIVGGMKFGRSGFTT